MRDMSVDAGGMGAMPMPPPRADHTVTKAAAPHKMMEMMHMTFFWSDRVVVLFPGWPGERGAGMYLLCLLLVLALAALTEALALLSRRLARRGEDGGPATAASAALLTAVHAARMGMAYLVMLAVMSFNVGVLLAAVAGHAVGFLFARSRVRTGAARGNITPPELCGVPPSHPSKP
ncbi:hypothetical protein ZWY2020_056701 [Hordeum vulgare]|nr:hypothetical protein ZWY2020_056701 [Hordeum vulgare]